MTDWAIIAARLLQFGSALVLFGSPLFYLYGFKGEAANWLPRRPGWPNIIVLSAAIVALLGAVWWVLTETAVIFSDPGAFDLNAVWTVLTGTSFGRAAFWRIGLIAASIAAGFLLHPGRVSWITQAVLGGTIVASFAWTGHGVKDEGVSGLLHLSGDVLHLLTAAIWIGALVPLGFLVLDSLRTQTERDARVTYDALESFSGVGPAVVAVLALTGVINSWFLVGPEHLLGIFTTTYGRLLLAKLIFFLAMLGLAAANRFQLSPRLAFALQKSENATASLEALRRCILMETSLALLVLFVVSWMGTLEPAASDA
jgi:putative copper resistance protein D